MRFKKRPVLIVALAIAGVLISIAIAGVFTSMALYAYFARSSTPSTAVRYAHLTREQANRLGLELMLPVESEDIRFYQRLQPDVEVRADFAVSEDGFLTWAQEQEWTPREITGRAGGVTDGFIYSTERRGTANTIRVVYDREGGRAYYQFRAAPLNSDV